MSNFTKIWDKNKYWPSLTDERSDFIKTFRKTLEFLGCTETKFKEMDPEYPNEIKYSTILPGKITPVTIKGKIE